MKFCLIGHPVSHSLSPMIHDKLFRLSGISGSYTLMDIAPDDLRNNMDQLKQYDGFNCTIPHKQRIISFLDSLNENAAQYGAVNTVKSEDGKLVGYNTDGTGFLKSIELAGIPLENKSVVVIGAGGVAHVLAFEAAKLARQVTIAARRVDQAEGLAKSMREQQLKAEISALPLSKLDDAAGSFDVLLQGTPSGMHPNVSDMPVSYQFAQSIPFVYDTIYNPNETLLLKTAREAGSVTSNGLTMLVCQAAAAQKIWTGADFSISELMDITQSMKSF